MLAVRLATAAILIPILVVVLWAGGPLLVVAVGLITLLAAGEVANLLRRAGLPVSTPVVALLAVLSVLDAAYAPFGSSWAVQGWIVLLVLLAMLLTLRKQDMREAVHSMIGTIFGALYAGLLAYLLRIPLTVASDAAQGPLVELLDPGRAWLLVLVLGVWAYDSAAYVTGRLWGRGRFFAHISPNKTWSGTIGGSVAAVLACAGHGLLIGRPLEAAGLGLLIAVAAPVGDLVESVLKRAAGVKDSGQLIPGHGGMLDRVDSFVTAAPAAWLYLAFLGLV
ncbi:MAG TPA: phosphatidate cytidylyltransferase [Candidatus Limnocylindria bacterium]|nr:phosphatidate cytidylyltransferase [Candidatus Limnocylindria bacterium]